MSDWDGDDYDPSTQHLHAQLVELGLDSKCTLSTIASPYFQLASDYKLDWDDDEDYDSSTRLSHAQLVELGLNSKSTNSTTALPYFQLASDYKLDWDDDEDYDPSTQLSHAQLVELGLDSKWTNSKTALPYLGTKNGDGAVLELEQFKEFMTEEEDKAAQLASDCKLALGLLGIEDEPTNGQSVISDFSASSLKSKDDFVRSGEKFGAEVASHSNSVYYLDMVLALAEHITKPMKKIQLESVAAVIQKHLDVYQKKEESERQKLLEQKQDRVQKKLKKKQLEEDVIEDEYDDYADKFF